MRKAVTRISTAARGVSLGSVVSHCASQVSTADLVEIEEHDYLLILSQPAANGASFP
jgi:hypothetical protein